MLGLVTRRSPATGEVPELGRPIARGLARDLARAAQSGWQLTAGAVPPKPIAGRPLLDHGRPIVLYVGAEYCPFCAAERWPLILALSRFGRFQDLRYMRSSSADVYPDTTTFSFYGARYESPYVHFTSYELAKNSLVNGSYAPLQTPPAWVDRLIRTYDAPPYVPAQEAGAIPFLDIANRFALTGSAFEPSLIGKAPWTKLIGALRHPTGSSLARAVFANANALTAAICRVDGNRPAAVCQAPAVRSLEASLLRP